MAGFVRTKEPTNMTSQLAEPEDYEAEYENFMMKISLNKKALQKILSNTLNEAKSICQERQGLVAKAKDTITELKHNIASIQKDIENIHGDKDKAGREVQRLQQDIEQINLDLNEKSQERGGLKKKLDDLEPRLKAKEEAAEKTELKNKDTMSNIERGAQMFHTHLGLDIKRTNHNSLIFIFTQVNRSKPDEEYMLELAIEEHNYRLLSSAPEIPNLQELEDRLNATDNFSGCIVYIRKLFQKMVK
ncbi:kinetochore protein Spc25-like isoform X5 [Homarus americanus]|uniref:kinetochore protein Spc25-like isoform X5 n=1 Tax=Homarus americanus TaxID=6706 RepID=UPI001C489832|nr:kinetochore protein Spc25-like isoform X5 [Homarus americanus]